MSIKSSIFIATSVDGFIARKGGELDWLDQANALVPEGEDCGFRAFMDKIDTLIMGRKTYEKVLSFGEWSYAATPVVVLSRNPVTFPSSLPKNVTHSSQAPHDLLKRLSNDGVEHVYVDGGATIQRFLSEDLIDEMTLTVIPILLGDGIPLFGPLAKDISLSHVETNAFDFGFVQTKYLVNKKP